MARNSDTNTNINIPMPDDGRMDASSDYLMRAREADESGDFLLSMYLYLAAFEKSSKEDKDPTEDAVFGLKQAWALACTNKERSLAEYIFELMEPFLTTDEISLCAEQLQSLAFEKLEEFGLSRQDLEDVAQMIAEDAAFDSAPIVKVNHISSRPALKSGIEANNASGDDSDSDVDSDADDDAGDASQKNADSIGSSFVDEDEIINYETIVGYDNAISTMQELGIGMDGDPAFEQLVDMLNVRHGLSSRPALDSMLFRAPVREDANRFMLATIGELDAPAIHMRMEENFQGVPVLCISTRTVDFGSSQSFKDVFRGGGVLVLEDIDLWESPVSDYGEDGNAFFMMQLTRGAREAVNLIRSAVENPEVHVLATASADGTIDEFFLELLEPLLLIDIDYPNEDERSRIWMDIAKHHPSIRSINKKDLVRYSANLARFDIYMAAREAIEEAYKLGLVTRKYQPVTRDNLFDKLAAYHPLDSSEYSQLEEEVVRDFQDELDHIDDILGE